MENALDRLVKEIASGCQRLKGGIRQVERAIQDFQADLEMLERRARYENEKKNG